MFWIVSVANVDIVQMGALGVLLLAICAYFWYLARRPAGNSNSRTDKNLLEASKKMEKVCRSLDTMTGTLNGIHEDLQDVCRKLDDLVKDQAELVGWLKGRLGVPGE